MKQRHKMIFRLFLVQICYTALILFILYPIFTLLMELLPSWLSWLGILAGMTVSVFSARFEFCLIRTVLEQQASDLRAACSISLETALHPGRKSFFWQFLYTAVLVPFIPSGWMNSLAGFYEMPGFVQWLLIGRSWSSLIRYLLLALGFAGTGFLLYVPMLLTSGSSFMSACKESCRIAWHKWQGWVVSAVVFALWLACFNWDSIPVLTWSDLTFSFWNYFRASAYIRYELLNTILIRALFLLLEDFLAVFLLECVPALRPLEERAGWTGQGKGMALRCTALAVLGILGYVLCPSSALEAGSVLAIGHKGSSTQAGNTIAAITAASEEGANIAEVDVQMSKDGVLFLLHDSSLLQTAGVDQDADRMRWDELEQLTIHDNGKTGKIPTLESALETARELDLEMLLDIKPCTGDRESYVRAIVRTVEKAGMKDMVYLQAEDMETAKILNSLQDGWKTGYVETGEFGNSLYLLDSGFVNVRYTTLTPSFLEKCEDSGTQLFVWTVDSRKAVQELLELGVDGVVSDDVSMLVKTLEEDKVYDE